MKKQKMKRLIAIMLLFILGIMLIVPNRMYAITSYEDLVKEIEGLAPKLYYFFTGSEDQSTGKKRMQKYGSEDGYVEDPGGLFGIGAQKRAYTVDDIKAEIIEMTEITISARLNSIETLQSKTKQLMDRYTDEYNKLSGKDKQYYVGIVNACEAIKRRKTELQNAGTYEENIIDDITHCSTWQEVYEQYGEERFRKVLNMKVSDDEETNFRNFLQRANELDYMGMLLYWRIQDGWTLKIQAMDLSELKAYVLCIQNCIANPAWEQMDKDYAKTTMFKNKMLERLDGPAGLNITNYNLKTALDELREYYGDSIPQDVSDLMNVVQGQITNRIDESTNIHQSESTAQQTHPKKDWSISGTIILGDDKGVTGGGEDDIRSNIGAYKPSGESEDAERLKEIGALIITVLRVIGVIVAVITLSMLGIKYMLAGMAERAEYKKTMIPFLAGAGILLVGTQLVGILYDLISGSIG